MTIQEFDEKLEHLNLKKTDFVRISNQKKGSVYNWGTTRVIKNAKQTIQIPDWVEPFLDNYEKALKYDQLRKLLM